MCSSLKMEVRSEKDKVWVRQSWSFNKALIVLVDFDGYSSPSDVNMDWCPFWVQVHGLPLGLMSEKVGIVLGEALGEVLDVDSSDDQLAWGRRMQIRVNVNVHKPLRMGKVISLEESKKVLAMFKYEKLSDFYYCCGRLDHQEMECETARSEGTRLNSSHRH